jgi:hypothetical protein
MRNLFDQFGGVVCFTEAELAELPDREREAQIALQDAWKVESAAFNEGRAAEAECRRLTAERRDLETEIARYQRKPTQKELIQQVNASRTRVETTRDRRG